jgi:hypothetical protein
MDNNDGKPSLDDTLLVTKTMRWLWLQKQLYQFLHRSLRKKRLQLEIEEKEALAKSLFFRLRMKKEINDHPEVFVKTDEEDNEGDEWKE